MVTKRHMLTIMAGASCIMGLTSQARERLFTDMMKEMERHEQEMQHYFDDLWGSFDRFDRALDQDNDVSAMAIAINPGKEGVKVTVSAVDTDGIEAAKNKEGNVLTIKDKQGALLIELALEHKNFLAVRAQQDRTVEREEKPDATQEKDPKLKEAQKAQPVKRSSHSFYHTAFGQWLPEKVDLGAATIEFVRKDKTLTITIPTLAVANESVPVTVK